MFGYLNSSSFSPLSYLGRAQAARLRVRFTAHNADESPLPIQLIIFPLIIFGSGADRKAARPIHRSQCGQKSASHTAHHFPPYHIWVGRRTARLCVRFLFPRFFSPPRRKKKVRPKGLANFHVFSVRRAERKRPARKGGQISAFFQSAAPKEKGPTERAGKFPRFFSPPRRKKDPPERAGKFPRFFSPPRRKKKTRPEGLANFRVNSVRRAERKRPARKGGQKGAPLLRKRRPFDIPAVYRYFSCLVIFRRFGIFQLSCDISSVWDISAVL